MRDLTLWLLSLHSQSNNGAMNIQWGDINNYEVYHKLGRGKYSEVFLGYCKSNN